VLRIAVGPQAGRQVLTLKLAAPVATSSVPKPFTVARDGFSLNAAVACAPHQRDRIERLCRSSLLQGGQHPTRPGAGTAEYQWSRAGGQFASRTAAIDLSSCPDCGGRLRVIADVTRPDVIQRI
jgi:hypothetical protein